MSDSPKKDTRREFLKLTGLGILGAVATSQAFRSQAFAQAGAKKNAAAGTAAKKGAAATATPKLEMVKPTDPQAQALGYVEDATKVDTKKWPKRAGPEGAKQFCSNCMFYQSKASENPPVATCTIFGSKGVVGKGWCNSWVAKPNA